MTAFITRILDTGSRFKELLVKAGWEVTGVSLVEFMPLSFRQIPASDWIFFTSQNAVRFFFENVENQKIAIPKCKWAALGEATESVLAKYIGKVDFTGTGDPATTATAFRQHAGTHADEVVLFPAARHSRQSLQQQIEPDFKCIRLEIYDNGAVSDPPFSGADVLVFTSPMNAEAYFSKHSLQEHQRLIAIGRTTAEALGQLGLTDVRVAAGPSEQALAEAVLHLKD